MCARKNLVGTAMIIHVQIYQINEAALEKTTGFF